MVRVKLEIFHLDNEGNESDAYPGTSELTVCNVAQLFGGETGEEYIAATASRTPTKEDKLCTRTVNFTCSNYKYLTPWGMVREALSAFGE